MWFKLGEALLRHPHSLPPPQRPPHHPGPAHSPPTLLLFRCIVSPYCHTSYTLSHSMETSDPMLPLILSEDSYALASPIRVYPWEGEDPGVSMFLPVLDAGCPPAQSVIWRTQSQPSSNLPYPPPPVFQSPLLWVEPNPQAPKDGTNAVEPYRPPMQHKIPPQKGRTLWPCTHRDCRAIFAKRTALEQVSTFGGVIPSKLIDVQS